MSELRAQGPRVCLPARRAFMTTATSLAVWPLLSAAAGDPLIRHDRASFFAFARSGPSLLAAGERGLIARSTDDGLTWTVARLPTRRNFTTILGDPTGRAVAAGHGGVIFISSDRGETWGAVSDAVLDQVNPDRDPILCGLMGQGGSIWLAGAFGLLIESRDQGANWQRSDPVAADFDRHVYGLFESSDGSVRWLVGESGTLARLVSGAAWSVLDSPYSGSFFGGLMTPEGATLVFGMRGAIYRKTKDGEPWQQCPCPQPIAWMSGRALPDGRIALVGDQGWMALSRDDGLSVELIRVAGASLGDLVAHGDGAVGLAGVQGLSRRMLPAIRSYPNGATDGGVR